MPTLEARSRTPDGLTTALTSDDLDERFPNFHESGRTVPSFFSFAFDKETFATTRWRFGKQRA